MVATCTAIVNTVVGMNVEDADRSRTWKADAAECLKRGSPETARAIYSHALSVFPGKKSVWRAAAQLEKEHGNPGALDTLLAKAVTYCPQARPSKTLLCDPGQMQSCLCCSACISLPLTCCATPHGSAPADRIVDVLLLHVHGPSKWSSGTGTARDVAVSS